MENVYLHLENICNRRKLEVQKIRAYLKENGFQLVDDRTSAKYVILFGCAFNQWTEDQSTERLNEFMSEGDGRQEIIAVEGIADVLGKKLEKDGTLPKSHIIRTGSFDQLDHFFFKKKRLNDVSEQNILESKEDRTHWVQVGAGCNDSCAFCGDKVVVKNVISKPLKDVVAEVQFGIDIGKTDIHLLGDDVGAWGIDIGKNFVDLLDAIVPLGDFTVNISELNIKYICQYGEKLRPALNSGRFKAMAVGYQSGSDRVLKLMKRGYTREQLALALNMLGECGVHRWAHVMIGFPTETFDEFLMSLELFEESKVDGGSFFVFQERDTAPTARIFPKVSEEEKMRRLDYAQQYYTDLGHHIDRRSDKLRVSRVVQPASDPKTDHNQLLERLMSIKKKVGLIQ